MFGPLTQVFASADAVCVRVWFAKLCREILLRKICPASHRFYSLD